MGAAAASQGRTCRYTAQLNTTIGGVKGLGIVDTEDGETVQRTLDQNQLVDMLEKERE